MTTATAADPEKRIKVFSINESALLMMNVVFPLLFFSNSYFHVKTGLKIGIIGTGLERQGSRLERQ